MNGLECFNLNKTFDDCAAVRNLSLTVRQGQLVALLGPSGCGKTTLLRLIAGFEWPDSGTIIINGRMVAGEARIPAEERRVGMVFQEYALFPHLDVSANISFGLRGSAREKQARVDEMLQLVGLTALGSRYPHELSGGQQQRIALARALAPRPDILLLDEPFSNLDAALRSQVRSEVHTILKAARTTCVFVTHDQEEALSLADEVAVMMDGRIMQSAAPQQVYLHPVNRAVAAFVGEANFLSGQAEGHIVKCALGALPLLNSAHGPVDILIRPENLNLTGTAETNAEVTWKEFYGHDQRIGLRLDNGTTLVARLDASRILDTDQRVGVLVNSPVLAFPLI
jgi:iron(III) transport system ATP-binding protein